MARPEREYDDKFEHEGVNEDKYEQDIEWDCERDDQWGWELEENCNYVCESVSTFKRKLLTGKCSSGCWFQ